MGFPFQPSMSIRVITTLLLGVCLIGFGSSVRLEVSPDPINESRIKEVNLTCVTDGPAYWDRDVVVIEIGRVNQKPMAVINQRGKLTMGQNSTPNMKAEGHIEPNARQSYLKLSIKNLSQADTGTYSCLVFYTDENYQLKEDKVLANLTIGKQGGESIVKYLIEKVSALEKTVQEQSNHVTQQKQENQKLTQKVSDLEDIVSEQRDKIEKQETDALHQRDVIAQLNDTLRKQYFQHSEKIKTQETEALHQMDVITQLNDTFRTQYFEQSEKIKTQETEALNQRDVIAQLSDTFRKKYFEQSEKIKTQETEALHQRDVINQLNDTFRTQYSAQSEKIKTQENEAVYQRDVIAQLNDTVRTQYLEVRNANSYITHGLDQRLHLVEEKGSIKCAFYMSYNSGDKVHNGDNMKFTSEITNIGKAYDKQTGLFTAPVEGIYAFHVVVMTYPNDYIQLRLLINGTKTVGSLYAHSNSNLDQSSVTAVVRLHAGDSVATHVDLVGTHDYVHDYVDSVFSGYLIQAL